MDTVFTPLLPVLHMCTDSHTQTHAESWIWNNVEGCVISRMLMLRCTCAEIKIIQINADIKMA